LALGRYRALPNVKRHLTASDTINDEVYPERFSELRTERFFQSIIAEQVVHRMNRRLTYNSDILGRIGRLKPLISSQEVAEEARQALEDCALVLPDAAHLANLDTDTKRLKQGIGTMNIVLPRVRLEPIDNFIGRSLLSEDNITNHPTLRVLREFIADRTQCGTLSCVVWTNDDDDVALAEAERRTVAEGDLVNPSSWSQSRPPVSGR